MRHAELPRFLLAGGGAAAINWLARIALSLVLPFNAAILIAYAIGMLAGFILYRHFVFAGAAGSLARQIAVFVAVNAVGAGVVLAATLSMAAFLGIQAVSPVLAAAIAHGIGIGIGAVVNYLGHRLLTFAPRAVQT